MRGARRLARNISVVAVAQAITWTATFFFTLAQARYLGPVLFGELSVAISWSILLSVVIDFGLSTKLTRDVAQQPAVAGRALGATLVVRSGLWCLVMPIMWIATVLLDYSSELQLTILIIAASLLFGGFAASLASYFAGHEEFLFPSLGTIALRGSAAVIGIAALALGQGLITIAIVYVIASVLQVIAMLPGLRRHPVSPVPMAGVAVVGMLKGTATLGFFWILGSIYYNVDIVILQRLAPPENVAWYAAAYRLFNAALQVVGFASNTVLYPVMSRLSVGSREDLRRAMSRAFTLLLGSGVFIALTTVIAADQIVALLYPAREYGPAANALRLLAPAIVTMYANAVFFLALLGMGYERRLLVMAAVLAVLNPIANVLLIPVFQQNAAALLTSATEVVVLAWALAVTPRDLRSAVEPKTVAKIALAAAPAAVCLWVLQGQSLFVGVPLAAVAYAAAVLALGVLPANDLTALRGLLTRAARGTQVVEQ